MATPSELLETSLQAIVLHSEAFEVAFYERLFTRFPETRPFFATTDMAEQRKKLQKSLNLIIEHLRHPEEISSMLNELGQRHVGYGVRPEHYPLIGVVMMETFADFLGPRWTQDHHDAWAEGYEAVSRLMLQGTGEPPPS